LIWGHFRKMKCGKDSAAENSLARILAGAKEWQPGSPLRKFPNLRKKPGPAVRPVHNRNSPAPVRLPRRRPSRPGRAFSGMIGGGIRPLFFIILVPLFVVITTFISSAIFHLGLMIVGGAKQPFETTFRVVCFAGGSANPLLVIPFCGGLIGGIWKIVLYCIGFARAHETDTGPAVLAVILPLVVCCGGIFALGMTIG